ncbi:peptide deformylase [Acaryochloris sp. IP29b_bin.148]|uniref:peptide deformylase n=1 Tax=Acaryochloris sp. IP29b_bin.148 TaxID=2969218 RepID=UPI002614D9D3|nr:peptide deformylase [Acaryochloris sp. IP29b_bin.148]
MSDMQREILQLGNPKLRQIARPIENPTHPNIQSLIDDLIRTMEQSNGVGIAAPQVGVDLQLVIVASRPTLRYPHAPQMAPMAMINPRFMPIGEEKVKDWEGCLSVPGIRGLVPRLNAISVEYQDRNGQPQQGAFQDFVARIIQHECDHLQGYIFVDRVETTRELITENEYHKRLVP